jgi:hypothetical protein
MQPGDATAESRLPAAALADQRETLAGADRPALAARDPWLSAADP